MKIDIGNKDILANKSDCLAIPLLNFLLIPVAVAGGTLLWRYLEDGYQEEESSGNPPQPK